MPSPTTTNPYATLNLPRSATTPDIHRAFRALSLKNHPDKGGEAEAFLRICEAYEVLRNEKLRGVLDGWGWDRLINGVDESLMPGVPAEERWNGWKYHGDPNKTFEEFFGGRNPFGDFFTTTQATSFGTKFGGLYGMNKSDASPSSKPPPIEKDLGVTLEELYLGGVRRMKIERKTLNPDNTTTSPATVLLTIPIKPGYANGTRITFPNVGHQTSVPSSSSTPTSLFGDVVFILKQLPHPTFERQGQDLIIHKSVELGKALTGFSVEVGTLDGRTLRVGVGEVVSPSHKRIIPNEGLPSPADSSKRGNLIIEFSVLFPTWISEADKKVLRDVLTKYTSTSQKSKKIGDAGSGEPSAIDVGK
ncbi:DnaJ sub B member 13 [Gaertneriomyces sp. JEL0708]|nr:DnaJ sub B member 13 [Gaertneriomyces sp. JEL0708]